MLLRLFEIGNTPCCIYGRNGIRSHRGESSRKHLSFCSESVDTKVIRIIETPLVPGFLDPMSPELLGEGGRIFAQELGYVFRRPTLI